MNILLSTSKDKGDCSCQPLLEAIRTTPTPTLSLSLTQLNILSSSSALFKCKSKPFNILAKFMSSKKRNEKWQMKKIKNMLTKLSDQIYYYFNPAVQSTSATAPALTSGALPKSPHMKAIDLLVKDIKVSKQGGDLWLLEVDLIKAARVFCGDSKSAEIYIAFTNLARSTVHSHNWIQQLL